MELLSFILNILSWVALPLALLFRLLLSTILTVLAPLLYLGHFILSAFSYPFQIIPKFEVRDMSFRCIHRKLIFESKTLYIFVGVAVIVGAVTGTSLHFVSTSLISIFNLENPPLPLSKYEDSNNGQSLDGNEGKEGDSIEANRRINNDTTRDISLEGRRLADWDWVKQEQERGRNGMIPNTILEEDDSSEIG